MTITRKKQLHRLLRRLRNLDVDDDVVEARRCRLIDRVKDRLFGHKNPFDSSCFDVCGTECGRRV